MRIVVLVEIVPKSIKIALSTHHDGRIKSKVKDDPIPDSLKGTVV